MSTLKTKKRLSFATILLCAAAWPVQAQFTSTANGAYDADATWAEPGNPANLSADAVGIGHHVHTLNAADMTSDALTLNAGAILEFRNNTGTNYSAASMDLTAAASELRSGRTSSGVGVAHTMTFNAASGARLALGGGRSTTLNVGANTNNNTPYGVTLNSQTTTTTTLNGTHTFVVNNNGTSRGTLTLTQRVNGTGSVQDTIVKQGAGLLKLDQVPIFSMADGDLINIEGGEVHVALSPTNLRVNFLTDGVVLAGNSTWASSTTLDFQQDGRLYGGIPGGGDDNPIFNSVFTGTGSITADRGQHRLTFAVNAASDWTGNLIAGNGGRGTALISNTNLNYDGTKGISLLTVRGSGTIGSYSDPDRYRDSGNSGMVRVGTNLTVGGIDNTGNTINTRIASQGAGASRVLTANVGISLSHEYAGVLSNGDNFTTADADTSTLAFVKTGLGTQTLSGQSYLNNYSGGTTIQQGILIANGGGAAATKSTTGASVNNGSTGNFTIADTSGLYVGKAVNGFNHVFISAISGTTVSITNRSGGTVAIPSSVTFNASSPTGTGAVLVNNSGTLAGSGYLAGAVTLAGGATMSGTLTLASTLAASGSNNLLSGTADVAGLTSVTGSLLVTGSKTGVGNVSIGGAGSLTLGNGGGSGSVSGDIANSGSLAINRNNSFALSNNISGSGSLTHNGSGTTTLSGIRTYTGATTVNGGTLVLDGGSHTGASGSTYVINGGNFTHTSGSWSTDLFHSNGSGNFISVNDLALSSDGNSILHYTVDTGGTTGITLTDSTPFGLYGNSESAWADEWTMTFIAPGMTNADWVSLNLMSSTGAYLLSGLNGLVKLRTWDANGTLLPTAEAVSNGQTVYILGDGSVGKYTVSFTASSFDLVFGSSRAIPEPSTLGLVALALGLVGRTLRKGKHRA